MTAYIIVFVMGLVAGAWAGWNFAIMGVKRNLDDGSLIWKGKKRE